MTQFTEFKTAFKAKAEKSSRKKFEGRETSLADQLDQLRAARTTLQFFVKNGHQRAPARVADADGMLKGLVKELIAAQALGASGDYEEAYELLGPAKVNAEKALAYVVAARDELLYQDPKNLIACEMADDWQGPPPKVHPASIKGFDALDDAAAVKAFRVVGSKINDGKKLLDRLLTDPEYASDPAVVPELKDVTDLMWFLRNKAEESAGAAFEKGALSIPDDGNLLRGYLDRCQEVYNRFSSHIKAQQDKVGGSARAVDAYEGDIQTNPDGLLPYSMNTMLVQSLQMEGSGEQRLYIKLETEGSRYGAATGGAAMGGMLRATDKGKRKALEVDPALQKMRADVDAATLPASRAALPADMERTIEHGKNLGKMMVGMAHHGKLKGFKRFAEDAIDGKKADFVKDSPYAAIVKAVEAFKAPTLMAIVTHGNYKAEINQMVDNLERLTAADVSEAIVGGVEPTRAMVAAVEDGIASFTKFLEDHGMAQDKESRVGSEVVLSADFLKPAGVDSASITAEMKARRKELRGRNPDELSAQRLQGLIDTALRSMARAKNFLKDATVQAAAEALQTEVAAARKQIVDLKRFDARWARERLAKHKALLEKRMAEFDADTLKLSARRAQKVYDEAMCSAFEVRQMAHLQGESAVVRAVDEVAALAEDFIEVIDALEQRAKTV
ncbi:MAG: hypothetical protein ABIO45_13430 [Burkholderiaceae bacterium]